MKAVKWEYTVSYACYYLYCSSNVFGDPTEYRHCTRKHNKIMVSGYESPHFRMAASLKKSGKRGEEAVICTLVLAVDGSSVSVCALDSLSEKNNHFSP